MGFSPIFINTTLLFHINYPINMKSFILPNKTQKALILDKNILLLSSKKVLFKKKLKSTKCTTFFFRGGDDTDTPNTTFPLVSSIDWSLASVSIDLNMLLSKWKQRLGWPNVFLCCLRAVHTKLSRDQWCKCGTSDDKRLRLLVQTPTVLFWEGTSHKQNGRFGWWYRYTHTGEYVKVPMSKKKNI